LLLLKLGVAKELGYTLARLQEEITLEELFIWSSYFEYLNDETEKASKRRR